MGGWIRFVCDRNWHPGPNRETGSAARLFKDASALTLTLSLSNRGYDALPIANRNHVTLPRKYPRNDTGSSFLSARCSESWSAWSIRYSGEGIHQRQKIPPDSGCRWSNLRVPARDQETDVPNVDAVVENAMNISLPAPIAGVLRRRALT